MEQDRSALIAMSGGVDSSVAACRMLDAGYRCAGVTMRLFYNETLGRSAYHTCCSQKDVDDAAEVCFQLGIPFSVLDCSAEFKQAVIEKFVRVYERGGTPNPCIDCNRFIKFDHLLHYAAQQGYSYLVTGHYARIDRDKATGRFLLRKAMDESKDQTYMLYTLTQQQLAHLQFPLGELQKAQTRALAEARGLGVARKHDSQDICFVPDGDYAAFLAQYTGTPNQPGPLLDTSGACVGQHAGAIRYTLGQRKGLGLAMGYPVYVCGKDMARNTVTVGLEEALYTGALLAGDLNYIPFDAPSGPLRVNAKTRYHQPDQPATLYPLENGQARVVFDRPQRAVTPGQAVVLYDGDLVIGGGTILSTE